MKDYAECWLDDFLLGSNEYGIDSNLISLFDPKDKRIITPQIGSLPRNIKQYYEDLKEEQDLQLIYYEASVKSIRDRLDVLGYDLFTAQESFRLWISEERNSTIRAKNRWQENKSKSQDGLVNFYREKCEILSQFSPEIWVDNLIKIHDLGLKTNHNPKNEGAIKDPIINYMLTNDWYGFPGYDILVPLRLALEAFEQGDKFIYDLTVLVWTEDFNYDDDFIAYGTDISEFESNLKSKTIVLTEGKTDAWILSKSLNLLYPHLKEYFSFLDFESTSLGGGVGNLANIVKAFAGAGITNNIIALFDNDTAATIACKGLRNLQLPPNIIVCRLPDLDFLKNYPTIGPSGSVNLDVNGIAASIELYFGEDVLNIDGKGLVPIQWTGYEKSIKKYQGEVLDKGLLQKRFEEKIIRTKNGEELNWQGLHSIFHLLFTSFLKRNRRMICKRASEYYLQ